MPEQGLTPGPLHWERGVLPIGPTEKSLEDTFALSEPQLCHLKKVRGLILPMLTALTTSLLGGKLMGSRECSVNPGALHPHHRHS